MTAGEQNEKMNLTGVPETMAMRAKLLPENGLISQIAMSVMGYIRIRSTFKRLSLSL